MLIQSNADDNFIMLMVKANEAACFINCNSQIILIQWIHTSFDRFGFRAYARISSSHFGFYLSEVVTRACISSQFNHQLNHDVFFQLSTCLHFFFFLIAWLLAERAAERRRCVATNETSNNFPYGKFVENLISILMSKRSNNREKKCSVEYVAMNNINVHTHACVSVSDQPKNKLRFHF